jgi:hypothetical protein
MIYIQTLSFFVDARKCETCRPCQFETMNKHFLRLRIMHDVDNGLLVNAGHGGLPHVCAWVQTSSAECIAADD